MSCWELTCFSQDESITAAATAQAPWGDAVSKNNPSGKGKDAGRKALSRGVQEGRKISHRIPESKLAWETIHHKPRGGIFFKKRHKNTDLSEILSPRGGSSGYKNEIECEAEQFEMGKQFGEIRDTPFPAADSNSDWNHLFIFCNDAAGGKRCDNRKIYEYRSGRITGSD